MATKKKTTKKLSPKPKLAAKKAPAKKAAKGRPLPKTRTVRKAAAKAPRKTQGAGAKLRAAKKTSSKKAPPKRAPAKKVAAKRTPRLVERRRRDATGHLDPQYAADLLAKSAKAEPKDPNQGAFLHGPRANDDLAEELGEEAVEAMTSGEDDGEDKLNQPTTEEVGGPFIVTPAGTEFADGTDASNPKDAKPEPFPTT